MIFYFFFFFFSSRRRHTIYIGDWSSDVCSSDLDAAEPHPAADRDRPRAGAQRHRDRKSVVEGKSVDLGGRRIIKKKKEKKKKKRKKRKIKKKNKKRKEKRER